MDRMEIHYLHCISNLFSEEVRKEKMRMRGNGLLLITLEYEAISFIKLRDSSPRKVL